MDKGRAISGAIGLINTDKTFNSSYFHTGILTFDGRLDEVRISNTVLSADWLLTEYNNQSSPSTFYTVAVEEAVPFFSAGSEEFNPGAGSAIWMGMSF